MLREPPNNRYEADERRSLQGTHDGLAALRAALRAAS